MKNQIRHTWKKAMAKLLVALMLIMSVAVITPNTAKAASKPALTKTTLSVLTGKQYDLNVKSKVAKSKYVWSTSNAKIATVNKMGVVKGVNQGSATITCKITTPKKNTYTLKCAVAVIKPAQLITIKNKVTALNVGQKYNFDRTLAPSTSKDKTIWTTSDASIAAPDKNGKFVAKKAGTVTITATTLSGAKDSVKFKVVDKAGTVTTQKELDALLGSGAAKITIKTAEAVNFTIANGDYSKQKLVVDAPKSDVVNNGKFASITINQIKADTWYERATGNTLTVAAANARIVVDAGAKVTIKATAEGAKLIIENNGKIEELIIDKKAEIKISGTSKESIKIVANIPGIKITTSVPLDLVCNAKIDLTLLKGAEATKIQAASKDVIPYISGNLSIKVTVGTGTSATEQTVVGTPIQEGTNGGYTGGGSGGNGGGSASSKTYTLDRSLSEITEMYVTYAGQTYVVSKSVLSTLISYLDASADTLKTWKNTVKTSYTYDGVQTVTVTGTAGSSTKNVEFTGGQLDGRSYTVTVNDNGSVTVVSNASGIRFIVYKSADNRSLTISDIPAGLSFTIKAGDTFVLGQPYTELKAIDVTYNGQTYKVDSEVLSMLKIFLSEEEFYLKAWKSTTNTTNSYGSEEETVTVTGTKGDATKTVSFKGGQLDGKSYTVTVADNGAVTVNGAAGTYTITKGTDNKSLTISGAPQGLIFTPLF